MSPIIGFGDSPMMYIGSYACPHAHNFLLNICVENGLIGLFIYAVFTYIYLARYENLKSDEFKAVLIACVFAIYLVFSVEAISRSFLFYIVFFAIVMLLIGASVSFVGPVLFDRLPLSDFAGITTLHVTLLVVVGTIATSLLYYAVLCALSRKPVSDMMMNKIK